MTQSLKQRIIRHIEINGPLSIAEYMHWCLFDEREGYYTNETAIGRKGDFITAPEVSQMFGELIGIWLIQTWNALGNPNPFCLAEIGPGNGTLMRDILRTCKVAPEVFQAANVYMIESSEKLAQTQRGTLSEFDNVTWVKTADGLPDQPCLFVANELLDALPFRQYVKKNDNWHENCVGSSKDGKLNWALSEALLPEEMLPKGHDGEADGAVFEKSMTREAFVQEIATLIAERTGAALFIDYGHTNSGFGDTFQSISDHAYSDPLESPGSDDLTSHVDFEALAEGVSKIDIHCLPVLTQGQFLLKAGLLERAGMLGSGASKEVQDQLRQQAERLAMPDQMGDLFKVFAISTQAELWPFNKDT